jgi:phosphoribosylamine--glycine ligase
VQDGVPLHGLEAIEEGGRPTLVFHAGTVRRGETLETQGGRILTVTGLGDDLAAARRVAYAGVGKVSFSGMQYRRDIGAQEASS